MNKVVQTSCYLTLEPVVRRGQVVGAKVSKVTQTRPLTPEGAPTIHLKMDIPVSVLEPLEAMLVVPESDIGVIPVTVAPETEDVELVGD